MGSIFFGFEGLLLFVYNRFMWLYILVGRGWVVYGEIL